MHHSLESDPQNGQVVPEPISTIVSALEAFAGTETLEDTLKVLEEQQDVLLLPETLKTIHMMIDEMFASGQNSDARNWRQYLQLLEEARHYGIERAWRYFLARQKLAVEALEMLTTAASDESLYQCILNNQQSLLLDAALVMLESNIQNQYDLGPQEVLKYWQHLLHFLEKAQERGVEEAWQTFKEQ